MRNRQSTPSEPCLARQRDASMRTQGRSAGVCGPGPRSHVSKVAALGVVAVAAMGGAVSFAQRPIVPLPTVPLADPCADARLHLRCPDLVMSAPFNLSLDRTTRRHHVLLRAASSINNLGAGPLELRGRRDASGVMRVSQAIYDRRGRAHIVRTDGRLDYKFVPGARYDHPSVPDYTYWKFRYAAGFELWSIDRLRRALRLVRAGPKLDYCFRDLFRTHQSARSPSRAVYPACSRRRAIQRVTLGTSVGWSDVYPYDYPEQWIDVTGLRGRFAYVQIADPRNLLFESNKQNNLSETYVELPSGRILGHRSGVSQP